MPTLRVIKSAVFTFSSEEGNGELYIQGGQIMTTGRSWGGWVGLGEVNFASA